MVINFSGDCEWNGIDGASGPDWASDSSYDDEELDGLAGTDGHPAVSFSAVAVYGTGSLVFSGGDGGNGGTGTSTDSSFWDIPFIGTGPKPGRGSDGGDGAGALMADFLVLDLGTVNDFISVKDGVKGEKGLPGNNGNVSTGLWVSLGWENYDIGKAGIDGETSLGTIVKICGTIRYE